MYSCISRSESGAGLPVETVRRTLLDEDGVTGIEMAILFPAVMLVVLSMFQISLYWHTANSVGVAAEQGVSAGRIHPDDPARAIAEAEAENAIGRAPQEGLELFVAHLKGA